MTGYISAYDPKTRSGMIQTKGGACFMFNRQDVKGETPPEVGQKVTFEPDPYIRQALCARKVRTADFGATEELLGFPMFNHMQHCPWCGKATEPFVVFKHGVPVKELCEFCRGEIRDLSQLEAEGKKEKMHTFRRIGCIVLSAVLIIAVTGMIASLF